MTLFPLSYSLSLSTVPLHFYKTHLETGPEKCMPESQPVLRMLRQKVGGLEANMRKTQRSRENGRE